MNAIDCTAYGKFGRYCRYSFYIANTLTILVCSVSVVYASWVTHCKTKFAALFQPTLYVACAYILIIVGILAITMALIALYAVPRELRCLMHSFSVGNLIVIIMLSIVGIMAFVFQTQFKEQAVHVQLLASLQHFYGQYSHEDVTVAWDVMQRDLRCCGVQNEADRNYMIWRTSKWHMDNKQEPKKLVPLSCCKLPASADSDQVDDIARQCQHTDLKSINQTVIYSEGCYDHLKRDLMNVSTAEATLAFTASGFLLLSAFFCSVLAKIIRK